MRDFCSRGTGGARRHRDGGRGARLPSFFAAAGRQRPHRHLDRADVLRRRPAAAADEADAGVDEAPRVRRHVVRRAEIEIAALDVARLAGVGLRRELLVRDAPPSARASRASRPDRRCSSGRRRPRRAASSAGTNVSGAAPSRLLPSSSVVICATIGRSHRLRTARIAAPISLTSRKVSRTNRSTPPSSSACACSRKYSSRLVDARLAPRLDADAQRADRAGHVGLLARRVPRDAAPPATLIACTRSARPNAAELHAVGAEGVGLDDVGAGADVGLVHFGDQVRLRQVQLVERAIEEHAPRVQHRAHRAVADEHAGFEGFEKGRTGHGAQLYTGHQI